MEFIKDSNWIYAKDAHGNVIAEVTYPVLKPGIVVINHTYVDGSLRGQGIAGELMEVCYDEIKSKGEKALLVCPYAVRWYSEHPKYNDIVIED
ncbi:MAG: N-acetyltransferase [Clostridiales Family XIII bacterium]|jgi:predicted GNAT family acetyltransferase|nr:N-acetyltransferase [Clostridiales Family XIII bacterium]